MRGFPYNAVNRNNFLFTDTSRPVLYIELGDSNSEATTQPEEIRDANVRKYASKGLIWDINASGFVPLEIGVNSGGVITQQDRFGAEVYLAAWYWMLTGRQLYIAKYARSGFTLDDVNGQSFHPDNPVTQYGSVTNVLSQALAGLTNPYIVLRYMGGTNDCNLANTADYVTNPSNPGGVGNLQYYIESLQADLGFTADKIVIPSLPYNMTQLNASDIDLVNQANDAFVALDSANRIKIEVDTIASLQADFHFDEGGYSRIAQETLLSGFYSGYQPLAPPTTPTEYLLDLPLQSDFINISSSGAAVTSTLNATFVADPDRGACVELNSGYLSTDADLSASYTFMTWVKFLADEPQIMLSDGQLILARTASNEPNPRTVEHIHDLGTYKQATSVLQENTWHHIAFTHDDITGTVRTVVDGVDQGTADFSSSAFSGITNLQIGFLGSFNLTGHKRLQYTKINNGALSLQDIQDVYNSELVISVQAAYQQHLGIQNYDSSRVLLRWDEPTVAADSFRLEENSVSIATPTSSTFFYEHSSLTAGNTYNYEVFAIRSGQPDESLGTASVTLPNSMDASSWSDFRDRLSNSKLNVNRRGSYGYADLIADESSGSISGVTDGTANHIGSAYEGALDLANGTVPGGSITATKEAAYRVLDSYLDWWIANGLSGGSWKRQYLDAEHLWVAETIAHLGSYIVADKGLTVGTVDVDAMIVKIDGWLDDALIEANPSSETEIEFFANKGFRLFNLAARAAVNETQADIDKVYEYLTDTFYRSYGLNAQGDPAYHHLGFPVDGNMVFQHNFAGAQTNPYGYGLDWYDKAIHEMMYCFDGGNMALNATLKEQVQDLLLDTRWTTHKNRNFVGILERQATLNAESDQFGSIVTGDISDYLTNFTGDADASKDTELTNYSPSSTTAGHITGVRVFPNNEMLVVKTTEAMLVAKSASARTMVLASGDGYQTDSFNLVPGAWNYDDEGAYDDLPAYDHRNFAGSLTEQLAEGTVPRGTGTARANYISTNTYAGAVQQGNIAVLAYQHARQEWNTIEANIAHFGLTNCMVTCLSDIQQTGSVGSDVRYTIDQKLWAPATNTLTYNTGSGDVTHSALFAPISTSISSTSWIHVNNMGYVIIPQGTQTLEIWGEARSGNWNDFDSSESSSVVNADIMQVGLNFGNNPAGANAVVIAFPASTPAAVASFAAATGITIDQLDADAIGISTATDQAVAFFAAGTVNGITTDQPILVAKSGNSVAVSDPEQTLTNFTYTDTQARTVYLPQGRYSGLATTFTV